MTVTLSPKIIFIVGLLLCIAGIFGARYIDHLKQDKVVAELQLIGQKKINDSTQAKLTVTTNSLQELAAIAHEINGRLIAGIKINIPAKDTSVNHDTLATEIVNDSTRTAEFNDSTFAGNIQGKVVAPPFPSPLGIGYTITRPAFSPEVGFVKVGNKTVAIVSWRGEEFKIDAPFADPQIIKKGVRPIGGFVGANWLIDSKELQARGGLRISPWQSFDVQAGLQTQRNTDRTDVHMTVGVEKRF